MLGAVARLLLSEKPKCNVAIREKIKVRSLCMYLFYLFLFIYKAFQHGYNYIQIQWLHIHENNISPC